MAHPTFIALLACLPMLGAAAASAADNTASAAAALKVLTQPAHDHTHTANSSAPARETLTVQRSETLDMLVRRQFAGWPFKDEVFRRALAELNPRAIPNAANNLLKRGSTLVLPNTEDLRRVLLQHYPASGELVRVKVEQEIEEAAARSTSGPAASADKQRRWVRYP